MSKNKRKKKQYLIAGTTAIALAGVVIPIVEEQVVQASTYDSKKVNISNFTVTNVTGGVSISLTAAAKDITGEIHVPSQISGKPVVALSNNAFTYSKASKIYFENTNTIVSIGSIAFAGSEATNEINLPNITSIPNQAFQQSKFSAILLDGNKITNVGMGAFYLSNATNAMSLPNITTVQKSTFANSKFSAIHLDGNKITSIGEFSFNNTVATNELNLKNIATVPYAAFDTSRFSAIHLDGSKIKSIDGFAFKNSSATNELNLPNLTTIEEAAFNTSRFSAIHLDGSKITSIGEFAFNNTMATNSMSLPNITTVPYAAFANSKFSAIHLDGSKITSIDEFSFNNAGATNEINLINITTVPNAAFQFSKFSAIRLNSDKIKNIGTQAFLDSSATNEMRLQNITTVPYAAFADSKFSAIHLDGSKITSIDAFSFSSAIATNEISLPNITSIPEGAFQFSKFSGIRLDWNKIKNIGNGGFINIKVDSLTKTGEILFSDGVRIEENAFVLRDKDWIAKFENPNNVILGANVFGPTELSFVIVNTAKNSKAYNYAVTNGYRLYNNKPSYKAIPNQSIEKKGDSITVDLSSYFSDIDGDNLTYKVTSSNKHVVADLNGSLLTLLGDSKGDTTITVSVNDGKGGTVDSTFSVTVLNTKPTNTVIPSQVIEGKGKNKVINLSDYFSDIDGDTLTYVVSSNNQHVSTSVNNSLLTLSGNSEGDTTVTVLANDNKGGTVSTYFSTIVEESSPIGPTEPTIIIDETEEFTESSVDLNLYFSDNNSQELDFTFDVLVNEANATIKLLSNNLIVTNPKKDGFVSVKVTATNKAGKKTSSIFEFYLKVNNENESNNENNNSNNKDYNFHLLLEQGDFSLQTKSVEHFGQIRLTPAKQTVTTGFNGDFGVIDARGTQEGWNVTVSATPFTVETFEGFVGIPHQLPVGSLALSNPTTIERIGHVNKVDGLPTSNIQDYTILDNSAFALLSANQGEGMGEFKFNFTDALALTVDALTAKIDNLNYPNGITPYISTITWDLVTGP